MKGGLASPSIICATLGKHDKRYERFKLEANKKGIVVREVRLIDIQVPVDERYDDCATFLRQNVSPILTQFIPKGRFFRWFVNKLLKKKHLSLFDYDTFNKTYVPNKIHPFGYLGLTPLIFDDKYLIQGKGKFVEDDNFFDSDDEIQNYLKLKSLKVEGFEPLKQRELVDEDFNHKGKKRGLI